MRVLIVEDNEALAFMLSEYLKDSNVAADFAKNGKDAVAMVELTEYDLILMDIYMPVMNGFEATSKINLLRPNTVIIAITSSNERLELERMKAMGAKDFLIKPINKEKLTTAVLKNMVFPI